MIRKPIGVLCCLLLSGVCTGGSGTGVAAEITVAFWNVENLFDEHLDRRVPDADVFVRENVREKLRKDAEIIRRLDADIVGLMEVENRGILRELCEEHLQGAGYRFHLLVDETDDRGIDVALISRRPFLAYSYDVPEFYRGILVARFTFEGEPLYVIVNHWKSRFGGGEDLRMNCAKRVVELVTEEIPAYEGRLVPVLIGGDFNDDDTDASVQHLVVEGLVNTLAGRPIEERWTLPYHDRDGHRVIRNGFDHVFINPRLREGSSVRWVSSEVVRPSVMIGERTIEGRRYLWPDDDDRDHLGYSDHFPVLARLQVPGP